MLFSQPAVAADLPAMQDFAHAQVARFHAGDPRLPAEIMLPGWLLMPSNGASWLLKEGNRLVGMLSAEREYWPPESPFSNVFPRRYLRLRLALAEELDAGRAFGLLLERVDGWNGAQRNGGRMMMHPVCDTRLSEALTQAGFAPYHTIAHQLMPSHQPPCETPPGVTVRQAGERDVPAIAALMAESWRFHADHQPAITLSPQIMRGCERQAFLLLGDGMRQVTLVADRDGDVIGFFSMGLSTQEPSSRPALFVAGEYGDIYEVGVRADQRRTGVGTAMFAAAWRWFRVRGAEALYVNFAPTNPTSSRFWPRLGFREAWINWWRS